jgi:hypothetical protein
MSQVNEIKCPDCGAWNQSTGVVDAKCVSCGAFLEPERVAHAEEVKLAEARKGSYYLVINENDETITQIFKIFINSVRWGAYYLVMLFFLIVAGALLIWGIVAI